MGARWTYVGARQVIVAMEHVTRASEPKILRRCTLPLTARREVDLVVTDMAVIRVTPAGLVLDEVARGTTVDEVVRATAARLTVSPTLGEF
jgi:3-oxoacid CoA-transferase B subunit